MRTLHRNKRKLYLCQVYKDGSMKKYREPIELLENWQTIRTESNFMNLGQEVYDFITIKTSIPHKDYYHMGDRLYIEVEPPIEHDPICNTADYEVYRDPIITLNECRIMLQKRSGRNGNKNIF